MVVAWAVIRFADGFVPKAVPLHELEDEETGRDGIEAGLQEGDKCLSKWRGSLYSAKVLLLGGDYMLHVLGGCIFFNVVVALTKWSTTKPMEMACLVGRECRERSDGRDNGPRKDRASTGKGRGRGRGSNVDQAVSQRQEWILQLRKTRKEKMRNIIDRLTEDQSKLLYQLGEAKSHLVLDFATKLVSGDKGG